MDRSRRLSPNMDPNCVCRSHWRNVGCLSEGVLGIFDTMLKGGCEAVSLYPLRGKVNFFGNKVLYGLSSFRNYLDPS